MATTTLEAEITPNTATVIIRVIGETSLEVAELRLGKYMLVPAGLMWIIASVGLEMAKSESLSLEVVY